MSCIHYQTTNSPRGRTHLDFEYPRSRYSPSSSCSSRTKPEFYRNECYTTWKTPESRGNSLEGIEAARGNPQFPEAEMQSGRMSCKYVDSTQTATILLEKMRCKLKLLEDGNAVMQARNQNLIRENNGLTSQLEEEKNKIAELKRKVVLLEEDLRLMISKSEETKKEAESNTKTVDVCDNETSTTNTVPRLDRGVQIWAVCKACQRKLESCEKEPPTVTITKSELEALERDMQTLRDAIITREESWDKAMEREKNYRQQLSRLTAETITARHLSETRQEEIQNISSTLSEKESELKSAQKDIITLNKLVVKLFNCYQRGLEDGQGILEKSEINEKDQKLVEEIVRRTTSTKGKQKSKPKSGCSERTAHSGVYQSAPRENKVSRGVKDPISSTKETKR